MGLALPEAKRAWAIAEPYAERAALPLPRVSQNLLLSAAYLDRARGLVATWCAHGCTLQAIVAAFGFDEWPVAAWWARAGRQGQAVQEFWVERPRDLGQVQADEFRVKTQGGIVWMALAMMVKTRLRWAPHRSLLVCTDGVVSSIRAMRGNLARSRIHGAGRRATAASVAPCLDRPSCQALRAAAGGRDRPPYGRWHAGTRGNASTPVARGQGDQYSLQRATERDMSGTPLPGVGTSPLTLHAGMFVVGTVLTFACRMRVCPRRNRRRRPWRLGSPTMAGRCTHCGRFMCRCLAGAPRSGGTSFTGTATLDRAMVCVTTVNCGATSSCGGFYMSTARFRLATLGRGVSPSCPSTCQAGAAALSSIWGPCCGRGRTTAGPRQSIAPP